MKLSIRSIIWNIRKKIAFNQNRNRLRYGDHVEDSQLGGERGIMEEKVHRLWSINY